MPIKQYGYEIEDRRKPSKEKIAATFVLCMNDLIELLNHNGQFAQTSKKYPREENTRDPSRFNAFDLTSFYDSIILGQGLGGITKTKVLKENLNSLLDEFLKNYTLECNDGKWSYREFSQDEKNIANRVIKNTPQTTTSTVTPKGFFAPFRVDRELANPQGQLIDEDGIELPSDRSKPVVKISPENEAKQILNEVNRLHQLGYQKVGITYSATQGRTNYILQDYKDGKWKTNTSGGGQAGVLAQVEQLLETDQYKHLQNIFRIIPISVLQEDASKVVAATDESVTASLKNTEDFIKTGGVVLGWTNRDGHNLVTGEVTKYAVNGGVFTNRLSVDEKNKYDTQNTRIQDTLKAFERKLTPANLKAIYEKNGGGFFASRSISRKENIVLQIQELENRAAKNKAGFFRKHFPNQFDKEGASEKTLTELRKLKGMANSKCVI